MHVSEQNSTRCKPEPSAVHHQHTSSDAKAFRYQYSSGAASAHCPLSLEPAKRCSLQGRRVFASGTALTGCAQSVIPHKGTDFIHYIIVLFSSMAGKWAKEIRWPTPGLGWPSAREGLRDLHRETATGPLWRWTYTTVWKSKILWEVDILQRLRKISSTFPCWTGGDLAQITLCLVAAPPAPSVVFPHHDQGWSNTGAGPA